MTLFSSWRSPLDPERVMQAQIMHWHDELVQPQDDQLTVEEPFEMRIDHQSLAVIMRTPGHDAELAMGFLFTEGLIQQASDVLSIEPDIDAEGLPLANVLNVTLRQDNASVPLQNSLGVSSLNDQGNVCLPQPISFARHFAVSASCGLCGKNSIADLMVATAPLEPDDLLIPATIIYQLSDRLRTQQAVFQHTGGLHAAAIFNPQGELLLSREDIGRHNAVDKLIGYSLLHQPFSYTRHILLVSGRTSFEIIQKALLARIPCVAAISAPSSLAVELAEKGGITLIGFLRNRSMNVYSHPERIVGDI